MYRNRANLGRKRGHRAPAIRPGGTLGLSEAADSDARLFQDSTGRADVSFVGRLCPCLGCAGLGGPGDAACADPAPGPCRAACVSRAVFRRGGGGGTSEPPDTDVLGRQRAESQPLSRPEPVRSEGTVIVQQTRPASWPPSGQPFSSPSSLHSSILVFPFFLSFCSLARALLDPVLCAQWHGRRNKVCSMSQTSRGSEGRQPCP